MTRPPSPGSGLAKLLEVQRRARVNPRAKEGPAETEGQMASMLQHGLALQAKGQLALAAEAYQTVLTRQPSNPDALHLMGMLAMESGEINAALDYFTRAVAGKPADPSIRCNLANALLESSDEATAEFHLRKALKLFPNLAPALCLLADCRAAVGDRQEAKRLYQEALTLAPEDPRSLIGYADLCVTLGEIEEARTVYCKAIALRAATALAFAGLANCMKLAKDSAEASEILGLLRHPGLRPVEYCRLSYAAASIADNAGDHDDSFPRYRDAKRLSAATFDLEVHRKMLRTIKGVFTKEFFQARAKHGSPTTRPVFIVGMPRSGTTLAEQIISRHPDAAAAGELVDIARLAASLGLRKDDARDYAKRLTKLSSSEAKELGRRYLSVLDGVSADALRVTDKMPHNFEHLGLIALIFPKARIIHCRRDPLDTCVSCFTTQLKGHLHGYAGDLATLGAYYRDYVSLMEHWREVLPVPIYDLDYERLIEEPELESRKLIQFIGLEWDSACLTPHESSRPVTTLSRLQVRQPIYRSSVGRWRRYEKHLGPLIAALGDLAVTPDRPASPD